MKTPGLRSLRWFLVGTAWLLPFAAAADAPKDGLTAYRVKFENDKVRVLEYSSKSGGGVCGHGVHSHPAHLTMLLTDAKVKIITPDGKTMVVEGKAGDTFWSPSETHAVENVSGQEARCDIIEIKDQDWKPSTGMTP